jgi:hypothetical protein
MHGDGKTATPKSRMDENLGECMPKLKVIALSHAAKSVRLILFG